MRIDLYLPGFAPHDAISNHTLQTRRVLREAGYGSHIWAEHILGNLSREARPYQEDSPLPGEHRLLVYQMSTGSAMAGWLRSRPGRAKRCWATTTTSRRRPISPGGSLTSPWP